MSDDIPRRERRRLERTQIISEDRIETIPKKREMTLVARSPQTTTTSNDATTTSCGPNDRTGMCERMVAASPNTTTIPIVLGVVIPLTLAFVILVILHRRHVKRLRREDAEDRTKSLDFGMDDAPVPEKKEKKKWKKGGKKSPEMSTASKHQSGRGERQLSMDFTNPYLLPPELQGSRESIHSLSRSIHTGDDKYRNTTFIPDDGSIRSPSSHHHRDDASIYTYSSKHRTETESTKGLLPNPSLHHEPVPAIQRPPLAAKDPNTHLLAPNVNHSNRESFVSTTSSNGHIAAMRASNNYLGQFISGGAMKNSVEGHAKKSSVASSINKTTKAEPQAPPNALLRDGPSKRNSVLPGDHGFDFNIPPNTYELSSTTDHKLPEVAVAPAIAITYDEPEPRLSQHHTKSPSDVPQVTVSQPRSSTGVSPISPPSEAPEIELESRGNDDDSDYYDEEVVDKHDLDEHRDTLGYDPRRLTMGFRPLPPDDPTENPEERAIRIRSFYKEYFDETTKPGGEKTRLSYFDGSENYIDDYYGTNAQSQTGHESYNYSNGQVYGQGPGYDHGPNPGSYAYGSRAPSYLSARAAEGRHRATISNGSYMSGGYGPGGYGPRAYSSASDRYAGPRQRSAPKKKAPLPQPLPILPSPSMLKDDSMLPNPNDFAPPQLLRDQRSGTPSSLRGGSRPFSSGSRAFNPLVSSFDDLSVLPSPHQLNTSGTFTSLDFAPPRFAAPAASNSDSGSIRSNRSGMSAMQLHNIRSGAYRLSRIPKEVAGTKDELAEALKPQWNSR